MLLRDNKNIVVKFLIISTWTLLCSLFVFALFGKYVFSKLTDEIYQTITICLLLSAIISIMVMFISIFKMDLKRPKTHAQKIEHLFDSYENFYEKIRSNLLSNGYLSIQANHRIEFYIKSKRFPFEAECVTIMKFGEEEEFSSYKIKQMIFDVLKNYYESERIYAVIKTINIIIADQVSSSFVNYVNENVAQGYKYYNFPVGIITSKKVAFMGTQKDGLYIFQYKKLRNKFLKILKDIGCGSVSGQ